MELAPIQWQKKKKLGRRRITCVILAMGSKWYKSSNPANKPTHFVSGKLHILEGFFRD